jgi:hypothetical protein
MTPIKSSLVKSAGKLFGVFNQQDLSLRGDVQSNRTKVAFSASGGNVADGLEPGNGYKYHTFTTPGTLTLSGPTTALEVLMVAGGGGGGSANSPSGTDGGAGGGAGGLIYVPGYEFSPGDHSISIGSGGTGAPLPSTPGGPDIASQKGGNTSWGSLLTAIGGGGGGSGPTGGPANTHNPFGSGGGQGGGGSGSHPTDHIGTGYQPTTPQNIPSPSYQQFGNPGGVADGTSPHSGGGGGGAGGAGGPGNNPADRAGGVGKQYPQFAGPLIGLPALNPLNGYFAGGGAGGGGGPGGDPTITHGADRAGAGGANGSGGTPLAGQPAVDYTGSGGGSGSGRWNPGHNGTMGPGGDGGDGIVIVRYPVS